MTSTSPRDHRDLLARARAALETPADLDEVARGALIEDLATAAATIDDAELDVAVALIDSGNGTRFHVATSDAALTRELAAWCRPRWDRTGDPRDSTSLEDAEIVDTYFAGDISEYFAIGTARIAKDDAGLEQGRYCVLSTAHVSHATSEWLERWSLGPPPPAPVAIATTFYGWFVATREPEAHAEPLPTDLRAAMRFGRQRGFDYILFDSDAAQVDGLDVHDW
ncbi:hypothetical protein QLH51_05745 [Sphingomonas sp. 2R-10]|uniref:DUF5983 family protein n=1 Tax=Sphingomonas sp. 2R-10 TaxID=3045148 RepID=UPI0019D0BC7E|nr:hypothetical protein [Sphingomonas sp. 2R-10]MDJ0276300.1 hypothetical protein [Sphingomonas sp. 2R-10]